MRGCFAAAYRYDDGLGSALLDRGFCRVGSPARLGYGPACCVETKLRHQQQKRTPSENRRTTIVEKSRLTSWPVVKKNARGNKKEKLASVELLLDGNWRMNARMTTDLQNFAFL